MTSLGHPRRLILRRRSVNIDPMVNIDILYSTFCNFQKTFLELCNVHIHTRLLIILYSSRDDVLLSYSSEFKGEEFDSRLMMMIDFEIHSFIFIFLNPCV